MISDFGITPSIFSKWDRICEFFPYRGEGRRGHGEEG